MDDDIEQGAWGEQELQERRRREDEALEHHRKILAESRKEHREFSDWMEEHRV